MKTIKEINQKNKKAILMILAAVLSSSCSNKFGGQGAGDNSAANATNINDTNSNQTSGLDIPVFGNNKQLASTQHKADASSCSLSPLSQVASATFDLSDPSNLPLHLFDATGTAISFDASCSFNTASNFVNTSNMIIVQLNSGSLSASVVIHKSSATNGQAFILDSNLSKIFMSSITYANVTFEQNNYTNVVQVNAQKADGTTIVPVALLYIGSTNSLYALSMLSNPQ